MILAASQRTSLPFYSRYIHTNDHDNRAFRNNVELGNVTDEATNTQNIRFAHWTVRTVKLTNTQIHINNSRHVETRFKAIFSKGE